MRRRHLLQLVGINLLRDRRGAFLSALGVAAGIAALAFFVSLGIGVAKIVKTQIFPIDARFIEVIPPSVSLGLFGTGKLEETSLSRLQSLPYVAEVHRKMELRVPAVTRYDGEFFGQKLRMGLEILAVGVDRGLVQKDLLAEMFEDPPPGGPVPVLISTRLLEIYNKSFAKGRGLPSLSARMLAGFSFPVEYGRSFVGGKQVEGETRKEAVLLSGVSDRAMLQGITMPLETVRRLNAQFGQDAISYSSLVLVAASPEHVPAVTELVRKMGFSIDDSERKLAENVGAAVAITTLALALLSLLICGLASLNIALSLGASVRSRIREIGILRAVGATSADVGRIILCEAASIGLLGGALGAILARTGALAIDLVAKGYLPEFPFKPESFFEFSAQMWVFALLLGVVASLFGAYLPARAAARLDPARAMGG